MYYENGCARDLQVAYIGGGSRGWAWTFMTDLANERAMCGTLRLYDIDRESAEANKIIGERIAADPRAVSPWSYTVEPSLESALTGADFVIVSILPGTFDEMEHDVHMPERLGIYQSVGDTAGPGGFLRALRTLPMIAQIGEAVKKYAPEAWVINFTNPMTTCIRTLYTVFPGIRAMGCCHEVFGTQKLMCDMLAEEMGIEGVERHEIHTTVTGINHFTWVTRASYKDIDLYPLYAKFAEKYQDGYDKGGDNNWMNSSFSSAQMVKFDLFRKYGVIAAAGDRHLTEFMPPWYNKSPEVVRSWKFGLTTVDWRKEDLKKRMQRSDDLISGKEELQLKASGEEGHLLLKAILGLGDLVSNVNIPNRGQIPNLPLGAVVETNAIFGFDRIEPVYAGPVPANILPLIARHVYNQENTLRAALTCDRKLGFTTFMNDPLMGAVMPDEGLELFNNMLENQKKYLPAKWFE